MMREVVIKDNWFIAAKEIDFFLRIHGHLPDANCGAKFPFLECKYTPSRRPINEANENVEELRRTKPFRKKEKAVLAAQVKWQTKRLLNSV